VEREKRGDADGQEREKLGDAAGQVVSDAASEACELPMAKHWVLNRLDQAFGW
jgi:hypothetical protein